MSSISSVSQIINAQQTGHQAREQVNYAVAGKALQVQKQQGQAAVEMVNQALALVDRASTLINVAAGLKDVPSGGKLDITV